MVREIGQTTVAWRKTNRLVEARPKLAGSQKRRTKQMKTKRQTRKTHQPLIKRKTLTENDWKEKRPGEEVETLKRLGSHRPPGSLTIEGVV